jgi:hypothetical protein
MPVTIVVVAKSAQIRAREGKPNSLRRKLQQLDCDGVSSRDRQLGVSVKRQFSTDLAPRNRISTNPSAGGTEHTVLELS